MSSNRVHIVIPKDLTDEIDAVVGQRHRSAFICEAAQEKLIRAKQARAIREVRGALKNEDYPEWKNGSAEWVHNLRQEDQRIRDSKLGWPSIEAADRHQHSDRRSQRKTRAR
jgi:metal-responsive CopG/Arc/MetJ family transcriptional regulator